MLVEYPGVWSRDVLGGSLLQNDVKTAVREQLASLPHTRLLFIRRPGRRAAAGRRVYVVRSGEREGAAWRGEIADYAELAALDVAAVLADGAGFATPVRHPLLLVCTHGKRDRCCARYGRPLYDRVREWVNEDWVWQSTHVGGDRFAGNLVCLPEGLYFGRVGADAWPLLDEYLAGRIWLDRYRGRSCHPFPAQAAERAVRKATGLTAFGDVTVESLRRAGHDAWLARLVAGETSYEVDVRLHRGELTYLTCDALTLRHPRRYVAATPRAT
ncbi:MAG: sucrase ferredoxin [Thermoleophilia bacterium]|nr:sucrase ferredoxin [Thermoleophilia bacterium]